MFIATRYRGLRIPQPATLGRFVHVHERFRPPGRNRADNQIWQVVSLPGLAECYWAATRRGPWAGRRLARALRVRACRASGRREPLTAATAPAASVRPSIT